MVVERKISKKEASHQRILNAAVRAIRRGGHAGASVAEVMKKAGLTHGGFYAHFRSRDEMVASAIGYASRQSGESTRQSMMAFQKRGATPFRSLIESYFSARHMATVDTGCVVAALGSEIPRQQVSVRRAAEKSVYALIRLVESVLPTEIAGAEASHIAATMVGALQLARALGGAEGKALLAAHRESLIDRYDQRPLKG
jgi:AcrR family transcriptional regulator